MPRRKCVEGRGGGAHELFYTSFGGFLFVLLFIFKCFLSQRSASCRQRQIVDSQSRIGDVGGRSALSGFAFLFCI